jgi:dienelactone hydrolase
MIAAASTIRPNRALRAVLRMLLALLATSAIAGCTSARHGSDPFDVAPISFRELGDTLKGRDPSLRIFERPGPFTYQVKENVAFRVDDDTTIVGDVVLPDHRAPAPLVIMSHGNHSRKEAHRYQAERLASFGMYVLVLQVPNTGHWIDNGRTIGRLVRKIAKRPRMIHPAVSAGDIVLVGHSFGGSAITVAAGSGAPVKGLILLDPAVVNDDVKAYMRKVDVPVMLLGADRRVFRSRQRHAFYDEMGGAFAEVSVVGATHDDAQQPSMFTLTGHGVDPFTSTEHQRLFTAAITAAAFSLTATDGLDYAWKAFAGRVDGGQLRQARRRAPQPAQALQAPR